MKRELSGGITSRKRFAGKSDFSAKQVSTTLLLLLLCLLMPQKGWADIVTTTYDFESYAKALNSSNAVSTPTMGESYSGGITNGQYGVVNTCTSVIDGSQASIDLTRFAFRPGSSGWDFRNQGNSGAGLLFRSGTPQLAITNLKIGDQIQITFRAQGTAFGDGFPA